MHAIWNPIVFPKFIEVDRLQYGLVIRRPLMHRVFNGLLGHFQRFFFPPPPTKIASDSSENVTNVGSSTLTISSSLPEAMFFNKKLWKTQEILIKIDWNRYLAIRKLKLMPQSHWKLQKISKNCQRLPKNLRAMRVVEFAKVKLPNGNKAPFYKESQMMYAVQFKNCQSWPFIAS